MLATQVRETILVSIDPGITAKAAAIAAEAGDRTTANVLEEWLERTADRLDEMPVARAGRKRKGAGR